MIHRDYKSHDDRRSNRRLTLMLTLAFSIPSAACGGADRRNEPVPDEPDAAADTFVGAPADAGPADTAAPEDVVTDNGTIDPAPRLGFGERCTDTAECTTGLCLPLGDGSGVCTRECDLDRANDCRTEGRLCLRTGSDSPPSACGGPAIETGTDTDDAILGLGDCVTRRLNPLGTDRDLFRMQPATTAPVEVAVQPDPSVDVNLEIFAPNGDLVATSTMNGRGGIEGLRFDSWAPDQSFYVLVSDGGSAVGNPYQICVRSVDE